MASNKETKKPHSPLLHDQRLVEMATPTDTKPTPRLGTFLNPLSKPPHNQANNFLPKKPLLSEIFPHHIHQWLSTVTFRGWYGPQKKWKQWVEQLSAKYTHIWTQAGIHQAILSSVYEVRSNPDIVLGLSEFWSSETNTFIFPWGEATVTLEDVMIISGYSVLGEVVNDVPVLSDELLKLEESFNSYRLKLLRKKGIKATHYGWLKVFMEEKKDSRSDFVHIGFLAIWLSRYVFPSVAGDSIRISIIPIAVQLSKGVKLALGPAVLASLYHSLTFLRQEALSSTSQIKVSGPFQLLQIWAFERFPILGPKPADLLLPGLPRMARWEKLNLKLTLPLVRLAVMESKNFCWRPYVAKLRNWRYPSYCKEKEQLFSDCDNIDDELRSFHRFLLVSEVVGMEFKEKYFPHRVAMQFGFDQDIPAHLSKVSFSAREPAQLFVPSRSFQPCVTLAYSNWWKELMLTRKNRDFKSFDQVSESVQGNGNSQDYHASDAARNSFDAESESSEDSGLHYNPPKVSSKVPFKDKTSNNDSAVIKDGKKAFATDFPTTPTTFKELNPTVSPPPGFQNLSSKAKKRLVHDLSDDDQEPASVSCIKKAKISEIGKKQPQLSIQDKGCKSEIPVINSVKMEYCYDDDDDNDDDVVIISHLGKDSHLQEPRKPLENAQGKMANIELVKRPTKDVEENNVSEFSIKATFFHREIKVESENTANEPSNAGFDVKMDADSSKELGASIVKRGVRQMAGGESWSNPINLDDEDTATVSVVIDQNHKQNIQRRLQKLEEVLGIV